MFSIPDVNKILSKEGQEEFRSTLPPVGKPITPLCAFACGLGLTKLRGSLEDIEQVLREAGVRYWTANRSVPLYANTPVDEHHIFVEPEDVEAASRALQPGIIQVN